MNEQMAIQIIEVFEDGAETIAINDDNSEWRTGSNLGPDWNDVDFDDFLEILEEEGLEDLI